ncbi:MAG: hypothetical protein KGL99_15950, partial [Burkholderiales bacterium]|nr:hypothetical protein [Burkholderiales bacterium]
RPTIGRVHWCSSARLRRATYVVAGVEPPEFTKPSCLGVMIWKPLVILGVLAATKFLPEHLRGWVGPVCGAIGAGGFWGLFLVALPLRKFFDVSETQALIALAIFTVAFVVLFTRPIKKALEKSRQ